MTVGAVLIIAALFMVLRYAVISERAGRAARTALVQVKERIEDDDAPAVDGEPSRVADGEAEFVEVIDGTPYLGVISIPSADVELPVISEFNYNYLNIAPCRYRGAIGTDDVVIVGHNYSSHFGRLSSVDVSDRVVITLMNGTTVSYTVTDTEKIGGSDVSKLDEGSRDLTILTCDMTGNYRLLVRCIRN